MPDSRRPKPDTLTLLVFKENLPSRTFSLSVDWVNRLGILLALILVGSLATGMLGLRSYWLSPKLREGRLEELHHQIDELKATQEKLRAEQVVAMSEKRPSSISDAVKNQTLSASGDTLPAPPPTLPAGASSFPIHISHPAAVWRDRVLQVRFNIQYMKTDGQSQQGRIVAVAKGDDFVFAYPPQALNKNGLSVGLVDWTQGEYFSVGRFREVKALFEGAGGLQKAIREIHILIFDLKGMILIEDKLELNSTKPNKATARRKEIIEPTEAPAPVQAAPAPVLLQPTPAASPFAPADQELHQ